MRVSHEQTAPVTPEKAFGRLQAFIQYLIPFIAERRSSKEPRGDMECFERELHEYVVAAERELLAEELARLDVDLPAVTIEGELYRQVVRCEESYVSAAGPVRVMRSLYRRGGRGADGVPAGAAGGDGGGALDAARGTSSRLCGGASDAAGRGRFVPRAGEPGLHGCNALGRYRMNMTPSKSSLDRLPKQVSKRWEAERERFEAALRAEQTVPREALTVAISLDGVMVPMKDGRRAQKRQDAKDQDQHTRGPAGYQEVGCGTLSFYDAEGERLSTVRLARMPEKHKATLKDTLGQELAAVLGQRPDLTLVKLADGAKDNWSYLGAVLPQGIEIIDFYHACEHLKAAFDAAYGENSSRSKAQFEKYRHLLRDEHNGVEKVIRALCHLRDTHPRKRKLSTELAYFRRHRHRMRYAQAQAQNFPIGSGVVEAACKTLATQRMKRSGMRWRQAGGQAILTLRALHQSERFERAWKSLSITY